MKNKNIILNRDVFKILKVTKDDLSFTLHDFYTLKIGKLKFKMSGHDFYNKILGQMEVKPKGGEK